MIKVILFSVNIYLISNNMFPRFFIFTFLVLALFSCKEDNQGKERITIPQDEKPKLKIHYENLSQGLFNVKTPEDVKVFLEKRPRFSAEYLEVPNAADPKMVEFMYNLYSNPQLKAFCEESEKYINQPPYLKDQLTDLFENIKFYYPNYNAPEVNTIVTGFKFNKDISVSDSLVVISTDYFLGPKAQFRPVTYDYFLSRYDKPFITPMIAMALSNKFNEVDPKDETMLAHMIYHGKTLYFMERVLPETPDSLLIMYPEKTVEDIEKNVDVIWGHFIDKKLFYETKPRIIEKYIGESPKISEIGEKCPGRIGRWLGWQIVRKYMKDHPDVTLEDLMSDKNARKIFDESKYKPKKTTEK